MTYSEKLKSPKWQKKRLEIMQRDNFKCRICEDENNTLNIHHILYKKEYKNPWDYPNELLITLCESCHNIESKTDKIKEALEFFDIVMELTNTSTYLTQFILIEAGYYEVYENYTRKEAIKMALLKLISKS